jgi:hypothetical protein
MPTIFEKALSSSTFSLSLSVPDWARARASVTFSKS